MKATSQNTKMPMQTNFFSFDNIQIQKENEQKN